MKHEGNDNIFNSVELCLLPARYYQLLNEICHFIQKNGDQHTFWHSDSKEFHKLKCCLQGCKLTCQHWLGDCILNSYVHPALMKHNVAINPPSTGVLHCLWPFCHATFLLRIKVSLNHWGTSIPYQSSLGDCNSRTSKMLIRGLKHIHSLQRRS